MTILVLCNVGNRDVKVRDEALAHRLGVVLGRREGALHIITSTREGGKLLAEHFDEAIGGLAFDILEPCLDHVLDRHKKGIDRLILFGTDQPEGLVADFHRAKDTLHYADVMARYYQGQTERCIEEVEARYLQNIDAALYDEAFEAYGRLLADLPRDIEACYLVVTGGVPACNAALLLQGVRRWGERARVLYLPEGRTEPRELRAGEQILASFSRAVVEAHLERLDFAAALPLMAVLEMPRALRGLVAYAKQRLDFDFDTAQETLLDEVERYGDLATRRFVDTVCHDLDTLLKSDDSANRLRTLLTELFWNSQIAYQQRRYADFLARVYRFQEAVLRYLVETIYGWSTDLSPMAQESTVETWNQALLVNTRLMTYLTEKGVNGWPLTRRQINRYTFKALMAYALDPEYGRDEEDKPIVPPEEQSSRKSLFKRLNAFDGLVELRHRTVVGHDFDGVSLDKIRREYPNGEKDDDGQPDPIKGMSRLLGALGIDVRRNPYRYLADFVADQLQDGNKGI